jgi:hypothetical protein
LKRSDLETGWREVRPELSPSDEDVKALWDNMKYSFNRFLTTIHNE